MKVELDHLGIAVENLEQSLVFYSKVLGFEVKGREHVAGEQVEVAILPAGGATKIELLEASTPDSTIARFVAKRGPGLHHIALRVDDLTQATARLRDAGCQLLDEPRVGAEGHRYVFIHPRSAGGVLLELVEEV